VDGAVMPLVERAHEGLHEHLFRALPALPPGPVLDVACGTGAWLSRFPDRERVGIERDTAGVALAGIEIVPADLDREDVDLGRRFALVSAIEIVEHLENPGRLVSLAARHLALDGWFLLSTPNVNSVVARARWLLRGSLRFFDGRWADSTHVSAVTLTWLQRVLPRHGLEPVRVWGHRSGRTAPHVRLAAGALALVVPQLVPGDTLCVLARPSRSEP
jgi:2-polyprenyl-3-methyl-5-hydroxy-6-metoxy-1,4-benzoquinol methylase